MIWVYTDSVTERLEYTLNFMLREHGIDFRVTNDPGLFAKQEDKPRFVYADYPFDVSYPTILPAELLFEDGVTAQSIEKDNWYGEECLKFDKRIDPIASVFYVLTSYEAHLDFIPDEHGRFTAKESILKAFNWLHKPMCDIWSETLIQWLNSCYSDIKLAQPKSDFLLTFDIDNTYAFKYKTFAQLIGGRLKDFLSGNHERKEQRSSVISNSEKDPFDTFDSIEYYGDNGVDIRIFWLLGDLKKFDRNVPWTNSFHQRLIRNLSRKFTIGIHPSYFSTSFPGMVKEERGRLEYILEKPVYLSRQHFLKIQFPSTFIHLNNIGITEDYSLGFSDDIGFRIGTARVIHFFDLTNDNCSQLKLKPFMYMDGTLNQYLGLTIDEAKKRVEDLILNVVRYGGTFCCIWHNETIGENGIWKGWKEVLDFTVQCYDENKMKHEF
jgi:hypothetical protein